MSCSFYYANCDRDADTHTHEHDFGKKKKTNVCREMCGTFKFRILEGNVTVPWPMQWPMNHGGHREFLATVQSRINNGLTVNCAHYMSGTDS